MAKGRKQILVKISHSCAPDPDRVQRGLEMWAAFLADGVRNESRRRGAQKASTNAG
jgi:hypothetical protein